MEIKNYFAHQLSGAILLAPTVYVYEPGTTIPVAGLKTAAGADLANPFNGSAITGLIQFAAPDGDYDLRVVGESRDFTIRIQCLDASDVVASAQGYADDAADSAAAAAATLASAVLLTGDQTVAGVKTFSSSPGVPTVADSSDSSTKTASTAFTQAAIAAALDAEYKPYVASGFYPGVPGASAIFAYLPFALGVDFLANFAGSSAKAKTGATQQTDFDIKKNGASVGTMRFSAGSATASFIAATAVSFAAGDTVEIVAPETPDTTLANIGWALNGSRE